MARLEVDAGFRLDRPDSRGVFAVCYRERRALLVNDIADIEKDRLTIRTKKNRPLPSGALPASVAVAAAVVGGAVGLVLSWRLGSGFLTVACMFLALNLLYSFVLKRVVLLDVVSISLSFVLRAIAGVEALRDVDPAIAISPWLLICTLFLSLFLAFCQRRYELTFLENAADHRAALQEYSPSFSTSWWESPRAGRCWHTRSTRSGRRRWRSSGPRT